MTNELWDKLRGFIEPKKRREVARIIRKTMVQDFFNPNLLTTESVPIKNLLAADAGDWLPAPVEVPRTDGTGLMKYEPCCECRRHSSWKGCVPKFPVGRDIVFVCCEHMPWVEEPWLIEDIA